MVLDGRYFIIASQNFRFTFIEFVFEIHFGWIICFYYAFLIDLNSVIDFEEIWRLCSLDSAIFLSVIVLSFELKASYCY